MGNEVLIWIMRWSLAGTGMAIVMLAGCLWLDRSRVVPLRLLRAAMLLSLALPLIALVPPVMLINTPEPVLVASDRNSAAIPAREQRASEPSAAPLDPREVSAEAAPDLTPFNARVTAVMIWVAGLLVQLLLLLRSARQLRRAYGAGQEFHIEGWPIASRLSPTVSGPILFGALHPRLLLPQDFGEWPPAQQRASLAHEREHWAHRDLAWSTAASAITALYWWSPPVRLLAAMHQQSTEEACDIRVVAKGENRMDYVLTLVALARRLQSSPRFGLAMIGKGGLRRRLNRLELPPGRNSRVATGALGGVAFGAAVTLVALGPIHAGVQSASGTGIGSVCSCTDDPPFVDRGPVTQPSRADLGNQDALLALSQSPDPSIRAGAVRALGDWLTPAGRAALRNALNDRDPNVQVEAVRAIARNPGRDRALVVAALNSPHCQVSAAAAAAMARLRSGEAQPTLIRILSGGTCVQRRDAGNGLSGYQTPESAIALRAALDDPDSRVRQSVAASLARVGDGSAVTRLIQSLATDESKNVREAAAEALGRVAPRGDSTVIDALRNASRDSNEHVRYAAVSALSQVGDERAEPELLSRLGDPSGVVREAAAQSLGIVGSSRAVGPLQQLVQQDENEHVRAAAVGSIARLVRR